MTSFVPMLERAQRVESNRDKPRETGFTLAGHWDYEYRRKPEDEHKAIWHLAKHRGGPFSDGVPLVRQNQCLFGSGLNICVTADWLNRFKTSAVKQNNACYFNPTTYVYLSKTMGDTMITPLPDHTIKGDCNRFNFCEAPLCPLDPELQQRILYAANWAYLLPRAENNQTADDGIIDMDLVRRSKAKAEHVETGAD